MPDAIHLEADGVGDVVADQLKAGMADPLGDVGLAAGEIVVEAEHFLAGLHQPINKMRAEKAGAAGNKISNHDDQKFKIISSKMVVLFQPSCGEALRCPSQNQLQSQALAI